MRLNRVVVDKPRQGPLVRFSPSVKGDAERCVEYYSDKPEVIQRLVARGYLEMELKDDVEDEVQAPKAPPRTRRKAKAKASE